MASRLQRTQNKNNLTKGISLIVLSAILLGVFVFIGVPALGKLTAYITGGSSPITSTTEDTTPPPPPRIFNLPEATNKDKITIKGTAEEGSTVILVLNKSENIEKTTNGKFEIIFALSRGENTIRAKAIDAAGNTSLETNEETIIFDDEAPELIISSPESGSSYYGESERQVTIEGTTESDASVTINNRRVVVEPVGSFTFFTSLTTGENKFDIVAKDSAGNETKTELLLNFSD